MENNSPIPEPTAPMAEFDKSPPTEETAGEEPPATDGEGSDVQVPVEDSLPPPPVAAGVLPPIGDDVKRSHYEEDEGAWGCGNWFEYTMVTVLSSVLLVGSLALTLFWVLYYRDGFAWTEDPKKQFNLHPVLMVAGFITFSGFSILLYRVCRCCRRIYVKLLHTVFHALAIPCVVVGFLAVLDSHNLATPPLPNFYSLHSWLGCVTMGLFGIQFLVGFFSFLLLLCCDAATQSFREAMVPIHASFGLVTFVLAVATCLTGLTEKAIYTLGSEYSSWPEEGIVMNALGLTLIALAILISFAVRRTHARNDSKIYVTERL